MIPCIAIDDEPIALDIIRAHASKVTFLNLKASFVSATEALAYMQSEQVDLIFLDINMPDISGLEFSEVIKGKAKIIFTTAYPEHAVKGFELAATDYLLKPISFPRFLQACTRAQEQREVTKSNQGNYLFVKDGFELVRIDLDQVLYIKAEDNYIVFQETGRKTLTRMTMAHVLEKLPAHIFCRVHKSYIVAVPKIEKVERHQLTIGGISIPLSVSYRDALMMRLA